MEEYLRELNEAQLEAVTATEGFVRVIAGAGSGKTRALTCRFAYLVKELGILPGNILCVTFTNKAAREMRSRIHGLTGDRDTGFINTFHGFCVSVLGEDSHALQYPESFLVLDNSDIDSMLGIIYEERGLTLRDMTFKDARDMIEIQKLYKKPDYYLDMLALPVSLLKEKYLKAESLKDIIFYGYLYQEKKCFGLDYNDLIKFTLYLFRENPDIRLKWQQRLEYIMIDEFQDIDFLQYELMEVLCGYHGNLFIVGDPDQTIYTWRGANVKYLLEFANAHPGTRTVMMTENYRSTPQIVAAANSLISKNLMRIKKDLIPTRAPGEKPLCRHEDTRAKEALFIAGKIRELADAGIPLGDIAVLYRSHYITRSLEEVFLSCKLPYRIYSGIQFYDRAEIKDALSYLRLAVYGDDLSFRRIVNVPKRNMGKKRLDFLEKRAEEQGCSLLQALRNNIDHEIFRGTKAAAFLELADRFSSLAGSLPASELLVKLLEYSGYEALLRTEGSSERLDNLAELKQSVYEFEASCGEETDPASYLTHVALYTGADEPQADDRVKLMTVHAAKGLEFPYVFLCAMNEDVFPSKKISTLDAMEEERRLAFVAITRAQRGLYFSEAAEGSFGGPGYPSRFILDIDEGLLLQDNPPPRQLIENARSYISSKEEGLEENLQEKILSPGTRVKHPVFGPGTVESYDGSFKAHTVKFDGLNTPRRLALSAKLEILEKNSQNS